MTNKSFSPPQNDFLDIWTVNLRAINLNNSAYLKQILDEAELNRANAFKFEKDKVAFLKRRVALRRVLAHYATSPNKKWRIERKKMEKPRLSQSQYQFNTSNSNDYALIAVSSHDVGIDVEKIAPLEDLMSVAQTVFTQPELDTLIVQSDEIPRQTTFYQYWSLKEAYLKGIGLGFSVNPKEVTFDLAKSQLLKSPPQHASTSWYFWQLQSLPGYAIAVASTIRQPTIRTFEINSP